MFFNVLPYAAGYSNEDAIDKYYLHNTETGRSFQKVGAAGFNYNDDPEEKITEVTCHYYSSELDIAEEAIYPAQATQSNFNICFGMRACYCTDGFYSETNFVPNSALTADTVAPPTVVENEEDEDAERYDPDSVVTADEEEEDSMSAVVLIGIIVGCLALVCIAVFMCRFLYRKKKAKFDRRLTMTQS